MLHTYSTRERGVSYRELGRDGKGTAGMWVRAPTPNAKSKLSTLSYHITITYTITILDLIGSLSTEDCPER
jgi:hypothetical protein